MYRTLLLAAGYGTRLRPITDHFPKCLVPIGNRPLLEHWLQTLFVEGLREVLVNTHFQARQVKEFINRERFSSWVRAVYEPTLLGTAGTLRENMEFFRGYTTLLIHADNWCQCNFSAFLDYHHQKRPARCLITMMTFDTNSPSTCGIVETDPDGVVTGFHEKIQNPPGNRANGAVYILEPKVLEWLDLNPQISDFSTEVLPRFLGQIATWHNCGILRDIGSISSLKEAQSDPIPAPYWPGDDKWAQEFQQSSIFRDIKNMKFLDHRHD